MEVTQETSIDKKEIKEYWMLYDKAFSELNKISPCRQHFYESEFIEYMSDPSFIKFILYNDNGERIGMSVIATDLSKLSWTSTEFYKAQYPEQYKKNTIYYFVCLLIRVQDQGMEYSNYLLSELENFILSNEGVACFDCNDSNASFLPDLIRQTTERQGYLEPRDLGSQHYYGFSAKGFKPGFSPGKPFGEAK